jgi:hypothetical protein
MTFRGNNLHTIMLKLLVLTENYVTDFILPAIKMTIRTGSIEL